MQQSYIWIQRNRRHPIDKKKEKMDNGDILKGYVKGLETNIPWKIPHYGEHIMKHPSKNSPSRNSIGMIGKSASCQDIKFVNYVLEDEHYKYGGSSSPTTARSKNSDGKYSYMESDAVLEFNNMLRENQYTRNSKKDKKRSPLSRYKYTRTNSVPTLTGTNGLYGKTSQHYNNDTSALYHNYNANNIVKYDMVSRHRGVNVKRNSSSGNNNSSKSNMRIRYNPREYMDEDNSIDSNDGYIPKDMEINLEQLLSCDTVDRILSTKEEPTTTRDSMSLIELNFPNSMLSAREDSNVTLDKEMDIFDLLGDVKYI